MGFEVTEEFLIIFLLDGTQRKMNRSWGLDALTTQKNVERLSHLDRIYYGTWGSFDPLEWFCDVTSSDIAY